MNAPPFSHAIPSWRRLIVASYLVLVIWFATRVFIHTAALPIASTWSIGLSFATMALAAMPWKPLVGLIVFAAITHGPNHYGREYGVLLADFDILSRMTGLIGLGWLVSVIRRGEAIRLTGPIPVLMLIFIAWLLVTLATSDLGLPDWSQSFEHHPSQYLQGMVLFLVAAHTLDSRDACCTFGLALGIILVLRWLAQGSLILDNDVGALVPIVCPLAFLATLTSGHRVLQLAGAVVGVLLLVMLLKTQNRGGAVATAAAAAVMLWHFRRQWRIVLAIVPVFLLAAVLVTPQAYIDRFAVIWNPQSNHATATLDRATISSRFELWDGAMQLIRQNGWVGVGPGNFSTAIRQVQPSNAGQETNNSYLNIAVEAGVPGLILYLALFIAALARCLVLGRKQAGRWQGTAADMLGASFAAYLVAGLFLSRQDLALAYLLAGWVVALEQVQTSSSSLQHSVLGPKPSPGRQRNAE